MPIYKWSGEYWYGHGGMVNKKRYLWLWTWIKEKGEKYGFEVSVSSEKDPTGANPLEYSKKVFMEEWEDPELPRIYPGNYYWVWHNGAFFKVRGETERYVLVDIEECGYEQADALGIPLKDVACDYHQDQNVGAWWIKKREIKLPDEFGKGKYVYLKIEQPFYDEIFKVIDVNRNKMRVQGRLLKEHDQIVKSIKEKFSRQQLNMGAEPEWWWEGEWIVFEATFNLEELRRYRSSKEHSAYDFYLYGEEEVPYRL